MSHKGKTIIDQLHQLVSTPSVSSTDPSWDQGNRAVIDLLAGWLSDLGFHAEILNVSTDGSKANLIATLGSGPGGLVLSGHTDTVPYDDGLWKSNPLAITERDNRLYGLGSTDMKGFFPLAALKKMVDVLTVKVATSIESQFPVAVQNAFPMLTLLLSAITSPRTVIF